MNRIGREEQLKRVEQGELWIAEGDSARRKLTIGIETLVETLGKCQTNAAGRLVDGV
jgi:hypothetical protein